MVVKIRIKEPTFASARLSKETGLSDKLPPFRLLQLKTQKLRALAAQAKDWG